MLRTLFAAQRKFFDAGRITAYALAITCARLDDEACAKSYLAISIARREGENIALGIDTPFERFRKTTWFPRLLAKAGLPSQTRL
jgi:hypothetical protein